MRSDLWSFMLWILVDGDLHHPHLLHDWFWKSDVCWHCGWSQFTLELCYNSWNTLKISDFPGNDIYRQNLNWRVCLLQIIHMCMAPIWQGQSSHLTRVLSATQPHRIGWLPWGLKRIPVCFVLSKRAWHLPPVTEPLLFLVWPLHHQMYHINTLNG